MGRAAESTIKQEKVEGTPAMNIRTLPTPMACSFNPAPNTTPEAGNDKTNVTSSDAGPHALETMAFSSREYIRAIQKLELLDLDSTLPSLPQFVVVGDQSAGKSSIIEAVCDISLPRSQGTCTRCPFQITTTAAAENEPWSCRIVLLVKYNYDVKAKAGKTANKYATWTKRDDTLSVGFTTVHSREDLEEALKRAQLAILNPTCNPSEFLRTPQPVAKPQTGFSPNIVSLHITGPGLPELSFFDLPGAINVVEDEAEQHLVSFVERLTKNYLREEKMLVLLAVPCDQDTENSTAFRFVKESNALGRSMGVLTKPDLLAINRQVPIQRMLSGEIFKQGNGWFVAKSLSQPELDAEQRVSHAEARAREKAFFANTAPWCSDLAGFAPQLGVPALQDAVSRKLLHHIIQALPEIIDRVQRRLAIVQGELQAFPEQTRAPVICVMTEIHKVTLAITQKLQDDHSKEGSRNQYRRVMRGLREALERIRPVLTLATPGFKRPSIDLVSDDEDEEENTPPRPTPAKARKGPDGHAVKGSTNTAPSRTPRVKSESADNAPMESTGKTLTLCEIASWYENGSASSLPGQLNPKVTEQITQLFFQDWSNAVIAALQQVQALLQKMLANVIDETLAARKGTELYSEAKKIVHARFEKLLQEQVKFIEFLVKDVKRKPITYAYSMLDQQKVTVKQELANNRLQTRVEEQVDIHDASKPLKPDERKRKANEVKTTLPEDPYANHVDALATFLAYYDIAVARLVDTIASRLDGGLIHQLETCLQDVLKEQLHVENFDYCAQLLAEDPQREEQRRKLVAEQRDLEEALNNLKALPPGN